MRIASDSAHAGLATITTSPFLTDRVMWGCVRLSELPSSFFMMNSMRSLQWEYTVWGCLPLAPVLPVWAQTAGLFGWSAAVFACTLVRHLAVFFIPKWKYSNGSYYGVAVRLCSVWENIQWYFEVTWILVEMLYWWGNHLFSYKESDPLLLKTDGCV